MNDTIAAIATAPGIGGVSIVRISGPQAESILQRVFRSRRPADKPAVSHLLRYGHAVDGDEILDECLAVLMRAPRSYTREDVAELQLHGGSTSQRVLSACLKAGARIAEPGEFTRRAFENGRIDLSEAEAVMSLIAARGEQARKNALHQLEGGTSSFIRQAADELYRIQAGLAACIDYPEEISDEEATADLLPAIQALADRLDRAADEKAARLISNGLQVAIVGPPNAGKSSLLNALLGEDRAIVTDIPGTTRDTLSGEISLDGCLVNLIDTAGLRDTGDAVERLGVARAEKAAAQADLLLIVVDASAESTAADLAWLSPLKGREALLLLNKCDLPAGSAAREAIAWLPDVPVLSVSTRIEASLQPLLSFLRDKAAVTDLLPLTQPRHIDAAHRAAAHLRNAAQAMEISADLAATDLDAAQASLGEITGDQITERLLDEVFSRFCVGK